MEKGRKFTEAEKAELRERRNTQKVSNTKILQLTDKYRIVSDGSQYRIEEYVERKDKKFEWRPTGKYHTRLDWAIQSVANRIPKENMDSLMYVARQLDRIEKIVSDYENLNKMKLHGTESE